MSTSSFTYKWSTICSKLTSNDASKMLYRFVSGFERLSQHSKVKLNDSCFLFLKNNVAYDILGGNKLSRRENLSFSKSLDILHRKLIDLDKDSLLTPVDLCLSINSYTKFYQNLTSNDNKLYEFTQIPLTQLKRKILDLLDIATNNIQYLNHHDLTMVLNCMSKTNVKYEKFYKSTSRLLYNSLQEYYRLKGKNNSDLSKNLINNITPLSVSLLLNSFSKSDVELNWSLLNFFVKEYVPKNLDKFELNQLILTLNAFKKLNINFNSIKTLMIESDIRLRDYASGYNNKLVTTSLYTFGSYRYFPKFSLANLISYLMSSDLTTYSEVNLCNIYYALSNINVRHLNFIERLNEIVLPKLKNFTLHGIMNIFHSLSKLDNKNMLVKTNQESQSLEDVFLNLFSNLLRGDVNSLTHFKGVHNIPVVMHPTNICFGSAINLNLDPRLYNYFLKILVSMLKNKQTKDNNKEKEEDNSRERKINTILVKYREELLDEDQKFKLLCNNLGYKGMNQLYCILIHILLYVKGGLESIEYSVLSAVNTIMDEFSLKYNDSKKQVVLEDDDEKEQYQDGSEYYLRDEYKDLSKIQKDVYKTVCKIYEIEENENNQLENKFVKSKIVEQPVIIYQEHVATPYSVDIVLFKL